MPHLTSAIISLAVTSHRLNSSPAHKPSASLVSLKVTSTPSRMRARFSLVAFASGVQQEAKGCGVVTPSAPFSTPTWRKHPQLWRECNPMDGIPSPIVDFIPNPPATTEQESEDQTFDFDQLVAETTQRMREVL